MRKLGLTFIVIAFLTVLIVISTSVFAADFEGSVKAHQKISINDDYITFEPYRLEDKLLYDELIIKSNKFGISHIDINNTIRFKDYDLTYLNKTLIEEEEANITDALIYEYKIEITVVKPSVSISKEIISNEENISLGEEINFEVSLTNSGKAKGFVEYSEKLPYYFVMKDDLRYGVGDKRLVTTQKKANHVYWYGQIDIDTTMKLYYTLIPWYWAKEGIIATEPGIVTYGADKEFSETVSAVSLELNPLIDINFNLNKEEADLNDDIEATITLITNFEDNLIDIKNLKIYPPENLKIKSFSNSLTELSSTSSSSSLSSPDNSYSCRGKLSADHSKLFIFKGDINKLIDSEFKVVVDWSFENSKYSGQNEYIQELNINYDELIPTIVLSKDNIYSGRTFTLTAYLENVETFEAKNVLAYLKSDMFDLKEFSTNVPQMKNKMVKEFKIEAPDVELDKKHDIRFWGSYQVETGDIFEFEVIKPIMVKRRYDSEKFELAYSTEELIGDIYDVTLKINPIQTAATPNYPEEVYFFVTAPGFEYEQKIDDEDYYMLVSEGFYKNFQIDAKRLMELGYDLELKTTIKYYDELGAVYDKFEKTYDLPNKSISVGLIEDVEEKSDESDLDTNESTSGQGETEETPLANSQEETSESESQIKEKITSTVKTILAKVKENAGQYTYIIYTLFALFLIFILFFSYQKTRDIILGIRYRWQQKRKLTKKKSWFSKIMFFKKTKDKTDVDEEADLAVKIKQVPMPSLDYTHLRSYLKQKILQKKNLFAVRKELEKAGWFDDVVDEEIGKLQHRLKKHR